MFLHILINLVTDICCVLDIHRLTGYIKLVSVFFISLHIDLYSG
jgi:hypothetical protein